MDIKTFKHYVHVLVFNLFYMVPTVVLANTENTGEASDASVTQQSSMLTSLMPLLMIMVVFYFLILRPQQKRTRAHRETLMNMKKGDQVMTAGGIIGSIVHISDTTPIVKVEIAPQTTVQIKKDTILEVITKDPDQKKESDDKKSKMKNNKKSKK